MRAPSTCVSTKIRRATIAALAAMVVTLAGCGHKGPLKVPEPVALQLQN